MKKIIYMIIALPLLFTACTKEENLALDTLGPIADEEEPQPTDSCHFRTQTPGGWGSNPKGNNPGSYLHKNFAAAFPGGLTVGCNTGNTLSLTTAQAITDFLPCGGTPAALSASYTDPACIKNVLAGHLVALTLSTTFDVYDANFGGSPVNLGGLVIAGGTFQGWTVNQLLAEANNILGSCISLYTPSEIADALAQINQSFVDGKSSDGNGYLKCPSGGGGGGTGPN